MAKTLYSRLPALVLLASFILTVSLGFVVAQHHYRLLEGNNIDYSYFLQFTLKAFSPTLVHEMSINPYAVGEHMTFTAGFDGAPSMWDWMHIEPVKILPTYLYSITGLLLVAYLFYIVFYFVPLLYGAYLYWRRAATGPTLALALIAASSYFAFLLNATDYLRPYQILFPLYICFVLSLVYRRPLAEKILFFACMLVVREEALVIGAAALVWETLRNRRDAAPQKDMHILWPMWGMGILATILYVAWSGYVVVIPRSILMLTPALLLALCVFLAFLWWLWQQGGHMWRYAPDVLFACMTFVPVLYFMLGVDPHGASHGIRLIYTRYASALFYIGTLIILAFIYDHPPTRLQKRIVIYFFSLCIAVFIAYEAVPHESNTLSYIARWDVEQQQGELVYKAASIIPTSTPVLLDMVTIVAFADHDNTYAYNYLPAKLASTTGPTFPQNIDSLKKLIATHVPYAVLSNSDAEPLLVLLKQAGQQPILIEQNAQYSFYSIK